MEKPGSIEIGDSVAKIIKIRKVFIKGKKVWKVKNGLF
jgi:hypothetical protein